MSEQISEADEIAAFMLINGVTRCPTVVLNKSHQVTNKLSAAERAYLRVHEKLQHVNKEIKLAETFKKFAYAIFGALFLPVCKYLDGFDIIF